VDFYPLYASVERSDTDRNLYFPAEFLYTRFQCSRLFRICGNFLLLYGQASGLELLEKKLTTFRFILAVEKEYNCSYFIYDITQSNREKKNR
jgi:hypothetical protein